MHQSIPSAHIPLEGDVGAWKSKALPQGKTFLQKHGPRDKNIYPPGSILEDLVSLSC